MTTAQTSPFNNQSVQSSSMGDAVIAAAITSVLASLIMAAVVMLVFTVFLGKGPIYPVQVIGSAIYGESALIGFNAPAFLAGLVLHVLVGLAWGVVFGIVAAFTRVTTPAKALITGIIVAAVSMIDTYVFVPIVMNALQGVDIWRREVPMFWNWAAHIVFGVSFALYPAVLAKWLNRSR